MRGRIILILVTLAFPCAGIASDKMEKCAKELAEVQAMELGTEKFKALKKLARKCDEHVPTQLAVADAYWRLRSFTEEDWIEGATSHLAEAVKQDSASIEAQWALAAMWEQLGVYDEAVEHYAKIEKLTPANAIDSSRAAKAGAHRKTCEFMLAITGRSLDPAVLETDETKAVKAVDTSTAAMIERGGWRALQGVLCAIRSSSGFDTTSTAARSVRLALEYTFDRMDIPLRMNIDSTNDVLAGIVSAVASLLAGGNLQAEVNESLQKHRHPAVASWREGRFAGALEDAFAAAGIDTLRSYVYTESLTVEEKWKIPNLRGIWMCHVEGNSKDYGHGTVDTPVAVEIKQYKDTVQIIFPKIPEKLALGVRMTFAIEGRHLRLKLWETLGTIPAGDYAEHGELVLRHGEKQLSGALLRTIKFAFTYSEFIDYILSDRFDIRGLGTVVSGGGRYEMKRE